MVLKAFSLTMTNIKKKTIDGDLWWIKGDCFIHRIKNGYGTEPYWQYWVWRIAKGNQPNWLIGATDNLKEAKNLL